MLTITYFSLLHHFLYICRIFLHFFVHFHQRNCQNSSYCSIFVKKENFIHSKIFVRTYIISFIQFYNTSKKEQKTHFLRTFLLFFTFYFIISFNKSTRIGRFDSNLDRGRNLNALILHHDGYSCSQHSSFQTCEEFC